MSSDRHALATLFGQFREDPFKPRARALARKAFRCETAKPFLNHDERCSCVAVGPCPMEIKGPGRIETSAIKRKASAPTGGFAVPQPTTTHPQIAPGPAPTP